MARFSSLRAVVKGAPRALQSYGASSTFTQQWIRASSTEAAADFAELKLPSGEIAKLPMLYPSHGTDKFVDIGTLNKQVGVYTYDPGFQCTASCSSGITFIDGDKGQCNYRGYPVDQIAQSSNFLEVSYLLLHGNMPTKSEMEEFVSEIKQHMIIKTKMLTFFNSMPSNSHPMAQMTSVVAGLSAFYPVSLDPKDHHQHMVAAVRMIAKMPMISALIYRNSLGLPPVYPRADFTYSENLLYMMFSNPTHVKFPQNQKVFESAAKAMDVFLILHADHEQNASTSTVRIAGSSQANPYAAVSAGIASLWGPAHGGANEAVIDMLEQIGTKDNVAEFVRKVKNKEDGVRLMGFGHRVYKNYDPRAKYFKTLVGEVLDGMSVQDPKLEVAKELERIALEDEYFIKRKLYPNVDFYTGIMLRAIGIPTSMFTVMFALARTVGWITQWKEMVEEKGFRISRPRQIYIGHPERSLPK